MSANAKPEGTSELFKQFPTSNPTTTLSLPSIACGQKPLSSVRTPACTGDDKVVRVEVEVSQTNEMEAKAYLQDKIEIALVGIVPKHTTQRSTSNRKTQRFQTTCTRRSCWPRSQNVSIFFLDRLADRLQTSELSRRFSTFVTESRPLVLRTAMCPINIVLTADGRVIDTTVRMYDRTGVPKPFMRTLTLQCTMDGPVTGYDAPEYKARDIGRCPKRTRHCLMRTPRTNTG